MSLVPFVVEDTGRGERSMDIFSRLLMDRIVFVGGPINDQVANLVIAQILFLKMDNPKKEISIYIHSPGGYVTSGLAIYDTIQFLSCDVNTYCIGMAASISALILACGTKGKRFALPNGRVMIHQPSGVIGGTSSDIEKQADEIVLLKQKIATIMSNHCSRSAKQILIDSDRDFYMSPEEAKEYGLIDHVVTKQTSEESQNTAGKT